MNRPDYVYDGCGINGPDEYRTRVAALTPEARKTGIGKRMEVALNTHTQLLAAIGHLIPLAESRAEDLSDIAEDCKDDPNFAAGTRSRAEEAWQTVEDARALLNLAAGINPSGSASPLPIDTNGAGA